MRGVVFGAFLLATMLVVAAAGAHAIGLSRGEYTPSRTSLHAKLTFARADLVALVPALDADRDGHLSAREVSSGKQALAEHVLARVGVESGGAACTPALTDAALAEEDGVFVEGRFDCPSAGESFTVDVALLDDLPDGHRHVARVGSHEEILDRDHRVLTAAREAPPTPAPAPTAAPTPDAPRAAGAWAFFVMGIEHILRGYDHLVFLLGLVLARGTLRSLAGVVTAFTIGHSVTLAVAALGVWVPSSRVVEPAIALSILYVGVENFFVPDASRRWRITLPFGLVHGFGFAAALREIALPRAEIPAALVSFNVGVEAGQLAVIAAVLPVIALLRRRDWFEPHGVRIVSGAVAAAGGVWFVSRVAGG